MKKGMVIIMLLLFAQDGFGQNNGVCDYTDVIWQPVVYDSTDLSDGQASTYFSIDTLYPDNSWQLGLIGKAGFPASQYGGGGLQTDTTNPYPINNTSSVEVWSTNNAITSPPGYSINFWHYYDVDSARDSCIVQYSIDSGVTWLDYNWNFGQMPGVMEYDYNYDSIYYPALINKFLWSGKSSGWEQVKICTTFFIVGQQSKVPTSFGFRFLFISDSIQSNKPGWVIDKIRFKQANVAGAVSDYNYNKLNIYPNPSSDGKFVIDFPSTYVTGKFEVYDYVGRKVKTVDLSEHVDLSDLPQGMYLYKAFFTETEQWFSGKIEIL